MSRAPLLVVSTGCPASIGPEISVSAALAQRGSACVLVGSTQVLRRAARLVGAEPARLRSTTAQAVGAGGLASGVYLLNAGPKLAARDCRPSEPSAAAGAAQLAYVEQAYRLAVAGQGALVTAAVSKSVIAHSGAPGSESFRGHTEWLAEADGARGVTMCFIGKHLASALVTTHLPIARVARSITPAGVERTVIHLTEALQRSGCAVPRVVVCSLNPHAGEDELLGSEERTRIVPGILRARTRLGDGAVITGPLGAETAFRQARGGRFDGVVAMYHDQATIPMKLVDFGTAVNLTMGLSCVRTSVDHGTAYDIAWRGVADAAGMRAAMRLARRLV